VGLPRPRLGIPAQLLLASSVLVLLPWLGLELVRELQRLVLDAQEQALAATARRAAVALGDRPSLLPAKGGGAGPVLRLLDLPRAVVVDGRANDWDDPAIEAHRLPEPDDEAAAPLPLSAVYRVGRQGNGVYVLFEVRDADVVLRAPEPGAGDGDHLEIVAVTADDELVRLAVDAGADGPVSAWLLRDDGLRAPDNRISGTWRTAEGGWIVELRLPRTLVGERLAFAVVDVDDPQARTIASRLETSGTATREALAAVLAPAPGMADLLADLGGPRTRLWVIDTAKHVLAHSGSLDRTSTPPGPDEPPGRLLRGLSRLTRLFVRGPHVEVGSEAPAHEVDAALSGEPARRRRAAAGSGVVVLSAAHPVRAEGRVRGAVLVQEAAADILAVRGHAFDRFLGGILAVSLLGATALLALATRLSYRIRRLRDGVEQLTEGLDGSPVEVPDAAAGDEIGDLARSVAALAERQREHAAYLEQVGRRLSHEMRTPVGVVRTSLDNLRLAAVPDDARVYLDRADEGLRRLALILSRMSEATRLEQALAATEREHYDLVPVVRGCVEGYRAASPGREMTLRDPGEPLVALGSADLLAQLLDKLVDNALGFARRGTAVEVELHRYGRTGTLSVRNEGPPLPSSMGGRLFQSMVSVRPAGGTGDAAGGPHLGLGLYIVRLIAEFHGGSAAAHDRPDGRGVIVTVTLPLAAA
jgi:two-component system sensor histidine kinase ChvG